MKTLIEKVRAANIAYANGTPFLTDAEYDIIWKELRAIDPENSLLYHTSHDPTTPCDHRLHHTPIKGVQKAFDMKDLKPFIARFKDHPWVIEPKYDGVAAVIYSTPEDRDFELALFGDGIKGRDITCHLDRMSFYIPVGLYDRVELIIPNHNWDKSYGKNPRNTVAGWVARSSIPHPGIIEAIPHEGGPLSCPYEYTTSDELESTLLQLYSEWNKEVPMDGLMIKLADHKTRIKVDDHPSYYAWSVAWKPPIQTKETTVTDIEWNVSRTGRVVPTVIYEEIELCGTLNTRATGNNAKWIAEMDITKHAKITVGKAGEIIPKIISVNEVGEPSYCVLKQCPVCKAELSWKGKDLICDSPTCIVQLSKSLAYFYSDKGLDVKSIGEAMITELLYQEKLRRILIESPWALLDPNSFNINSKLQFVWGNKRYLTYRKNVAEVSSKKDPARFIAALGYPALAYKSALRLMQQLQGYGSPTRSSKKALNGFVLALKDLTLAKSQLKNFTLAPLPAVAKVTYCITGELSQPRSDMIDYLTSKQWQFSNQVSKFTDLLILGELKRITTKQSRAKELGIRIITEDELPQYLKESA